MDNCEDFTSAMAVNFSPSAYLEDFLRDFAASSSEDTSQLYVDPADLTPSSVMIAAETAAGSSEDPAVLTPSSGMIAAETAAGSSEDPAVLTPSSGMIAAETAASSSEDVGRAVLTSSSAMCPGGPQGTEATWGRWSGANYFFEDLLESLIVDHISMPNFVLDVDIEVNNYREYYTWKFSQGTVYRLKSRIQLDGDCTYAGEGKIVCPLTLEGLMVRYKSVVITPKTLNGSLGNLGLTEKKSTADLFVNKGVATLTLSQEQDGKRKLACRVYILEMTMRPPSETLVSADVDMAFMQETTKRCERLLRRELEESFASFLMDHMEEKLPKVFQRVILLETK
ncbi:hypothetical protein V5799_023102 [Amblyomma americanum]|uniref:Uncharacterized protein n=1 Tax=Amblyomma americanum TaxID=6943 RepID=A0AAQ4FIS4_AMBAM